ncbi:hypothetical protein E2C01_012883 [Portunus trituberculatus]|uniref:Uncharacterized protein n=1 Tax=Portunus trituberculatus TaxID=210409 RepID=A0A5B7DFC7_PORTR|nr:hypothetical protein [Portunus trituberculatus]
MRPLPASYLVDKANPDANTTAASAISTSFKLHYGCFATRCSAGQHHNVSPLGLKAMVKVIQMNTLLGCASAKICHMNIHTHTHYSSIITEENTLDIHWNSKYYSVIKM